MIISIASGKGGTGKTTITASLALSAGRDVQVIDCDVEEPNAALFLHPEFTETREVTTGVPRVDMDKCTRCGACDEICQFKAIILVGDTVLNFPELCHSCGGCMAVCPSGAITESTRVLGEIRNGHVSPSGRAESVGTAAGTPEIAFTEGRLRVGESMAPPLILQSRKQAAPDRLVIIDAPPGTSCPVMAAVEGTDAVLLVTEPTPFGLHDLKLAVGAMRILDLPFGLVINRCDIGTDDVRRYAEEEGIPVLMEIPFDRRIAEAYAEGAPIVKALPEYRPAFVRLFRRLEKMAAAEGRRA